MENANCLLENQRTAVAIVVHLERSLVAAAKNEEAFLCDFIAEKRFIIVGNNQAKCDVKPNQENFKVDSKGLLVRLQLEGLENGVWEVRLGLQALGVLHHKLERVVSEHARRILGIAIS